LMSIYENGAKLQRFIVFSKKKRIYFCSLRALS